MKAQSMQMMSLTLVLFAGIGIGVGRAGAAIPAGSSDTAASARAGSIKASSTKPAAKSSSLAAKSSKKSYRRKPVQLRGQMAPTSSRISEIQAALAQQGAYQGDPSGKWDDGTVDAMKKYQASQGLDPSGKLDARTLEKLGLGASTAGRAAPMPTANPAPNLLMSRSQVPQPQPETQPDDK
jgi:hypothetical protein